MFIEIKIKFPLLKTFFTEIDFITGLNCVYLGLIFLGLD